MDGSGAMHVLGVGWVDVKPSEWLSRRTIYAPDPEPRHADPEEERARVAELLRLRAEREAGPAWSPWPEPEVPMRVVAAGAAPDAVVRLLSVLQSAGWRVVVTYARGTLTRAREAFTGKGADRRPKHYPAVVVGSWALRAARPGRRAVAIWHDRAGRFTTQGVLCWGDAPARWVGIQEFERSL